MKVKNIEKYFTGENNLNLRRLKKPLSPKKTTQILNYLEVFFFGSNNFKSNLNQKCLKALLNLFNNLN